MSVWRPLAITLVAALAGCVYVPTVSNVYDPACHIVGAVAAASVVVSGTIVVAGNTYYWFEKRGQCRG